MKRKYVLASGCGIAAFLLFEVSRHKRTDADPSSSPALVRLVVAKAVGLLAYRHDRGNDPERSRVS